ncbi:MAG: hypothetical protein RL648_1163 [Verrucomicrobiota bacterium]
MLCWLSMGQLLPLRAEEVPAFNLDPLVVEAARFGRDIMEIPLGVTVLGEQVLQRGHLQLTMAEGVGVVPGVFVLNPDNYAQDTRIAIRGFGARSDFGIRGIRLYLDGLPLTTPDGQGEVDSIDLGSIERLEIIRGPAAALYGAAAGGVLHLVSEEGQGPGFAETRVMVGQTGLLHLQAKMGEGAGSVRPFISLGYVERDGFRDHSETRNVRLNGNIVISVSPAHRFKVIFNWIDFPLQNDPGGLTIGEVRADRRQARDRNLLFDAGEAVRQHRLGLLYSFTGQKDTEWLATLFHSGRSFENRLPFEAGGQVAYARQFSGASLVYRRGGELDPFRLRAGIDLSAQRDDRSNFDNLSGVRGDLALRQLESVLAGGAYLFAELALPAGSTLKAGLRGDEIRFSVTDRLLGDGNDSGDLSFAAISPFLGWWVPFSTKTGGYVSYSTAFETPTTTEFDNPAGGGFNPLLRPQRSRAWEAGLRHAAEFSQVSVQVEASVFLIDEVDGLVPYELEAFPGREFYRNASRTDRMGLEFSASASIGTNWTLAGQLTLSEFHYDRFLREGSDLSGNRLPGIPRSFAGFSLRYDTETGVWAVLESRFVGSLFANDVNSVELDAYSVADLRVGWRWQVGPIECEPFLAISNLFDRRYSGNVRINAAFNRYYEPAPDRFFSFGFRLRIGPTSSKSEMGP